MTGSAVVAIFDFPYEAQIARDNLELSGIPAVVANEHVASMQLGNSAGGIRLLVLAEHLERARLVLASDHSKNVLDELGEKEVPEVVRATTDVEDNYVALAESLSSASTLVKKQSLESMRCLAVRPERIVWQPLSGTRTSERSHRMQLTVGDHIGFRTTISAYLVSFLPLLIGAVLVIALSHKPIRSLSIETSQWISYAFFILLLFISWQTLMDKITTPDFDLKGARFIQNHRVWWWPWRVRKESFAFADILALQCIEISPTDDDSSPFFELSIVFKNYTRVYVLGMGRRDLLNDAELISLTIDKPLWLAKTKAD